MERSRSCADDGDGGEGGAWEKVHETLNSKKCYPCGHEGHI